MHKKESASLVVRSDGFVRQEFAVKVVQRIPVKIRIDEKEAQKVILRPGMNVEATVLLQ